MNQKPLLLALCAASFLLVGCTMGPRAWAEPDLGPKPTRITGYIGKMTLKLPGDLREDMGLDERGYRSWLSEVISDSLRATTGITDIRWVDTLPLKYDSVQILAGKRRLPRPSEDGDGWFLGVNDLYISKMTAPSGFSTDLTIDGTFYLLDWKTGRQLAYGLGTGASNFKLYMDRSNWVEATAGFASWIQWAATRRVPDTTKATRKGGSSRL